MNKCTKEYEDAYSRANNIETLLLEMVAIFCNNSLIDYKWNIIKIYGLSLKSVISPDNELSVVEIGSSIIEVEDLGRIKTKNLILNNYKINGTIPPKLFSKIGLFNTGDEEIDVINDEDNK